jgi:dihydrolipoamide dehydrogenase
MNQLDTQVAVVGAGPGGYSAAFMAADLGLKVALIDPEPNPGGVCLYRGCIPSKALLHMAELILAARQAGDQGITFKPPQIDIAKLRRWKDDVVAQLTGGLGQLAKQRKVVYLRGKAAFSDAHTLRVSLHEGDTQTVVFENAIIATGSKAAGLPGMALASERLMTSADALLVEDIPPKLLVVGGGYIGLEIGTVYAALGSRVTVVEMTGGLLPGVDRDLVRVLQKRVSELFEALMFNTTVISMKAQKNGLRVELEDGQDNKQTRIFDRVMVAVGRAPNTTGLGLDNTQVKINDAGFIEVNHQQQTAAESMFAIGDVVGEPMLAHKAIHEGRVAAEAIAGRKVAFDPAAIPAVVFTDPEIAWAGLTETQAKKRGIDYTVSRFPWGASGRAATLGRSEGLTRLLVDTQSEQILGVGIVGHGAGELIAEGVLAIEMGANATDLGLIIHPHPTLSETLMEAAHALHGNATSFYRPLNKGKNQS